MNFFFLIVAFFAESAGTVAGFGSSTIALAITPFFFDFQTALVLVAFLHIFGNIGRIGFFRFGLDRNILVKFGIPSVIFTVCGALLVDYVSQVALKGILGGFLVFYTYMSWSGLFIIKPTTATTILGGGLSGFLAGLIGTGGALRGAFLNAFGLPKEKYIATAAVIAVAVDATRIPVYVGEGFLESKFYGMVPVLFIVALLGSYVGKKVVGRISLQSFRRVVLAAIFLAGIAFIYAWLV